MIYGVEENEHSEQRQVVELISYSVNVNCSSSQILGMYIDWEDLKMTKLNL